MFRNKALMGFAAAALCVGLAGGVQAEPKRGGTLTFV